MAYVYQHIRLDTNEVFYIGIGSDTEGKFHRANEKKGRNSFWYKIVDKTDYRVEIIIDEISWEDAQNQEISLIKYYGRYDLNEGKLVNMTDGGEGGNNPSPITRKKLSEFNRGKKLSEEHKLKIAQSNKGKIRSPLSEEHRRKISESHTGRKMSEETKRKIGNKNKGNTISEEQKQLLRKVNLGKKLSDETRKKLSESLKGRKLSEEHKLKISALHKGKVISESHKKILSQTHTGKKLSEEHKRILSEKSKKQKISEDHKRRISLANTGRKMPRVKCPHCNKETPTGNFNRWHGDNCKSKNVIVKNLFW